MKEHKTIKVRICPLCKGDIQEHRDIVICDDCYDKEAESRGYNCHQSAVLADWLKRTVRDVDKYLKEYKEEIKI